MRIVICPVMEPQHEIDISQRLVAAIAEELWCLYGGNDHLNWLEAEAHLRRIVGEANAAVSVNALSSVETRAASIQRFSPEQVDTSKRCLRRPTGPTRAPAASNRRNRRRLGREKVTVA